MFSNLIKIIVVFVPVEQVHLRSHCKIPDDYEIVYSLRKSMRNLCVIFPDQLNPDFSSLLDYDKELDEILMCEFKKDFKNLNYHKKKIVYQLSCMRHFQSDLTERGCRVNYVKLDDSNKPKFSNFFILNSFVHQRLKTYS